jgi:hypothetical protein
MWKSIDNTKYEVNNLGEIRKRLKNKYKNIKTYRKGSIQIFTYLANSKKKQINVAKTLVELFIRKLNNSEVVFHKNGVISDNRLCNLKIMTRVEAGKITGPTSKSRCIAHIKENGEVTFYKSTRDAERGLYISRQTVSDYCNKKVKNRMFNLIWADNLEEESEV